jgi:hypothetical protein
MSKLKDYGDGAYGFYCPGCEHEHIYYTDGRHSNGLTWGFNGNMDKPTFSPSLLNKWGKKVNPNWEEPEETPPTKGWSGICHLFVTDGKIIYCSDSTHAYAGKTIEMGEITTKNHE